MAQANQGDTVRIHYTGKLQDGSEFDSSVGRDPLEFTIGGNTILPTLEAAIVGMSESETATVEVAAADAYGQRRDDAIHAVDRSSLPEEVTIEVGNRVQAQSQDGGQVILTIVEADEETVTFDANHPLAGEDLTFEVELVEIVASAA